MHVRCMSIKLQTLELQRRSRRKRVTTATRVQSRLKVFSIAACVRGSVIRGLQERGLVSGHVRCTCSRVKLPFSRGYKVTAAGSNESLDCSQINRVRQRVKSIRRNPIANQERLQSPDDCQMSESVSLSIMLSENHVLAVRASYQPPKLHKPYVVTLSNQSGLTSYRIVGSINCWRAMAKDSEVTINLVVRWL